MKFVFLTKLVLVSLFLTLPGGRPLAAEVENKAGAIFGPEFHYQPGMNRGDFLKQLDLLWAKHLKNPADEAMTLAYGRKLFEVGDFTKAKEVLQSLPGGVLNSAESMLMAAEIEYCRGQYEQAEKLYKKAYKASSGQMKEAAGKGLVLTYYQSGQYENGGWVEEISDDVIYLREMMKKFEGRQPFQIAWNEQSQVKVPFLMNIDGRLPIVALKVNGQPVNVIIDTGCDNIDLDESVATLAGIEAGIQLTGRFAGDKTADLLYGLVDSIELGGLEIQSVPVAISQINWEYTDENNSQKIVVHGIIGTGILQRFLATLDYPGHSLILRPKDDSGRAMFKESLPKETISVEMPFILADTHLMLAKGVINGKKGLNMFLDSGLEDPKASILLEEETLAYTGITVPKKNVLTPEGQGGLGGGDFSVGVFGVDDFYLGSLHQQNLVGIYGVIPPSLYFGSGFIIDGIISHNFLKNYSWTIDFESMTMIFNK